MHIISPFSLLFRTHLLHPRISHRNILKSATKTTKCPSLKAPRNLFAAGRVNPGLCELPHLLENILPIGPRLDPPHPVVVAGPRPRTPRPDLIHRLIQNAHVLGVAGDGPLVVELVEVEGGVGDFLTLTGYTVR